MSTQSIAGNPANPRPLIRDRLPEGLQRSLSALGHPLTLASVAVLLLNDHLLKPGSPSAFTGKLSDFAGLFFAPYLLAAGLQLVGLGLAGPPIARRLRSSGARAWPWVIWATYLLTAGLFVAVKVHPGLNAAANGVLRSAFGLPVQVALDPTDLIALLALAPSAWVWSRADRDRRRPPLRRSLAALGLASLAALATAPCLPDQPITHLVPYEGKLYALATAWEPVSNASVSTAEGRHWDSLDTQTLPPALLEAAAIPVALPKTACVPGLEQICYRAAGQELVEVSEDAGQTWRVAWTMPKSRRSYMERVASGYGQMLACGKELDLRAADVAILGEGPSHVAILALGNEGVLRGRYDSADWERIGVGLAEPTPEYGVLTALFPPMIILGETGLALAGGAAAFILLSAISWARLETGPEAPPEEKGGRSPWVVGGVIVFVLLVLMVLAGVEELIASVLPPLIGMTAVIVAMVVRWRRAARRALRPAEVGQALRISTGAGLLAALVLWLPFALWVVGLIPWYSAALWLAVVAAVALVVWNVGRLPRGSRPAPAPDQPEV